MSPCRFDFIVHACGHETLQHREGPYPSCHVNHPQEFRERYATDATFCMQQFCGNTNCAVTPLNAKAVTKGVKLLRDRLIENEEKIKELNDGLTFMSNLSQEVARPAPLEHACRCVHKVYSNLAMLKPYVDNASDYLLSENHRKVFSDAFRIVVGHLDTIPSCIKQAEQQIHRMPGWETYVDDRLLPGLAGAPVKSSVDEKKWGYPPKRLCASVSLGFEFGSSPTEETHEKASSTRAGIPISAERSHAPSTAVTPNMPGYATPANTAISTELGRLYTTDDLPNEPYPEAKSHFLDDQMENDNWLVWRHAGTEEEKRLAVKYEGLVKELGIYHMPKVLEEARRRESMAMASRFDAEISGHAQRLTVPQHGAHSNADARSQHSGNITPLSSNATSCRNSPGIQNAAREGHRQNPDSELYNYNSAPPNRVTGRVINGLIDYETSTMPSQGPVTSLKAVPSSAMRMSRVLEGGPAEPTPRTVQQTLASLAYNSSPNNESLSELPAGSQFTNSGVFIPFLQRPPPPVFGSQDARNYVPANTGNATNHFRSIYGNNFTNRADANPRGNSGVWIPPSSPYPPPPSVMTPVDSMLGTQQSRTTFFPQNVSPSKPLEGPHTCERCNNDLPSIRELYTHKQTCQPIKCSGCDQTCTTGVELFEHRRNCLLAQYKVRVSDGLESP